MADFTHFNEEGRAKMVDVSDKPETARTALAHSSITVSKEIYEKITNNEMKKGDVLSSGPSCCCYGGKENLGHYPDVSSDSFNGSKYFLLLGKGTRYMHIY